jgi:hypothetical protein
MGIGDWGLGIGPNPQSPIPNPQSPIPNPQYNIYNIFNCLYVFKYNLKMYKIIFKNLLLLYIFI